MSMMKTLPLEVCRYIYELDNTYREVLNESLKFIEHAVPVCTCSGEFRCICGNKCPKHNPSAYSDIYRDYDFKPTPFPMIDLSRKFRRICRNKCPKHNPSAYSDIFRDYDFIPFEYHPNYTPQSRYLRKYYWFRINWLMWYSITRWLRKSSEWLIIGRARNSFKKCQLKKEYLQRFMDMRDNQRKLVA
tara:strand:- start:206 stop:769 length:564 start_codon:yes stop_codon:yes gene_type:complete